MLVPIPDHFSAKWDIGSENICQRNRREFNSEQSDTKCFSTETNNKDFYNDHEAEIFCQHFLSKSFVKFVAKNASKIMNICFS